jgi:hypothetical protein
VRLWMWSRLLHAPAPDFPFLLHLGLTFLSYFINDTSLIHIIDIKFISILIINDKFF